MKLWWLRTGQQPRMMAQGPDGDDEPFVGAHFDDKLKVLLGVVFRLSHASGHFELHIPREEFDLVVQKMSEMVRIENEWVQGKTEQ